MERWSDEISGRVPDKYRDETLLKNLIGFYMEGQSEQFIYVSVAALQELHQDAAWYDLRAEQYHNRHSLGWMTDVINTIISAEEAVERHQKLANLNSLADGSATSLDAIASAEEQVERRRKIVTLNNLVEELETLFRWQRRTREKRENRREARQ